MFDQDLDIQTTSSSRPCEQHVHEIVGSTVLSDHCDTHSHRFATISDEAVPCRDSHIHNVRFSTDTYDGHTHVFCGMSGPAIAVGGGRHVHYVTGVTSTEDGHSHKFRAATLIENPTECK